MIEINCQSSIKFSFDKVIYFDPINQKEDHDADYVFITHPHYDHFSVIDILKIKKEDTVIVGPKDILDDLLDAGVSIDNIVLVETNYEYDVKNIKFKTVPAYNLKSNFHPKENNWLGYVITLNDKTYYIAGDTDALFENESIKCDVAFVPIGGLYTMDCLEAANFVNKLKPKEVIPIHYGMVVGNSDDLKSFKEAVSENIKVNVILKI